MHEISFSFIRTDKNKSLFFSLNFLNKTSFLNLLTGEKKNLIKEQRQEPLNWLPLKNAVSNKNNI